MAEREEDDDQQRRVDLGPGAEEGDLVAQAEQGEEAEQHGDRRPGRGPAERAEAAVVDADRMRRPAEKSR